MMPMLVFLWKHRERAPFGSMHWLKNWAKRTLTLRDLVRCGYRISRLERQGARIECGCYFSPVRISGALENFQVGKSSFIGRAEIQVVAGVRIGSRVCINDGVKILGASHDVTDPKWQQISKPIEIGDHAWIATNAILLHGIKVGEGAVVGAGAVVSRDVPPFAVVAGNPATVTSKTRPSHLDYSPVRFLALFSAWLGVGPELIAPGTGSPTSFNKP